MTDPIFVLGCHRSGTSVVAGLLKEACGVSMGELMPPTIDNPRGYYEAQGVVDAHRDLLFQMERDWTCPPARFRPGRLDTTWLAEQVELHRRLPEPWAVKDPRMMFLLDAWIHLGVRRAHLVGVVRSPADTIRSIEKRDGIREDRAEAIVEAYLARLASIAAHAPLPVIEFSSDGVHVLDQVRALARSFDLDWDEEAASEFFDADLVRHRAPLQESSPTYDLVLGRAAPCDGSPIASADLRVLEPGHSHPWPLDVHLSVRHARQRHELWDIAEFSTVPAPEVVELLLEGARLGGGNRPGVGQLAQIPVSSLLSAGASMLGAGLRPHGVIAHGLLAGRTRQEIEFFFRSMYTASHLLAELVVDVPSPHGEGLLNVEPPHATSPRPAVVLEVAGQSGWDHIKTQRVSPGRVGIVFRKRVSTDSELVPVVTDLLAGLDRIHSMDVRLRKLDQSVEALSAVETAARSSATDASDALRRRAERAERDLRRLKSRRSVRVALAVAAPFARVFRIVRTWKNSR